MPINERNQKPDGSYIDDLRLAQRFFNEAAGYKLLREMTFIPVPNVISHSYDENRRLFLETVLIAGAVQASQAASVCRMPATHYITPGSGPCDTCRSTVSQIVESFVQNTVLPQLRNLKSYSTGLNGYVMPPRWVIDTDDRLEWPVKTSSTADFVFVLHDLVDHNILVDTCTFEVRALVDLEESGSSRWRCSNGESIERVSLPSMRTTALPRVTFVSYSDKSYGSIK
jgi:hypothetical protein